MRNQRENNLLIEVSRKREISLDFIVNNAVIDTPSVFAYLLV